MLLISFLGALVTPVMIIIDGVRTHFAHPEVVLKLSTLFDNCQFYTMILFGLIVYTVISAYLFNREYTEKTLKSILPVPVSKTSFIASKFCILWIWIIVLTVITWASAFALSIIFNAVFGLVEFSFGLALKWLAKMLIGSFLLFLTISPFVFIAMRTKGVVVPVIASAVIVMGNAFLSNEPLGALFPWTSTSLLISGKIANTGYPYWLVIGLIILVSALGFITSFVYFGKEDIK